MSDDLAIWKEISKSTKNQRELIRINPNLAMRYFSIFGYSKLGKQFGARIVKAYKNDPNYHHGAYFISEELSISNPTYKLIKRQKSPFIIECESLEESILKTIELRKQGYCPIIRKHSRHTISWRESLEKMIRINPRLNRKEIVA
ncbi:MAG: hypothetical protein WC438_04915 [Candidatus Pacearchaeota archaeon]